MSDYISSTHIPKDRLTTFPRHELITVTTDESGNAEVTSDNYIIGELLALVYDDGTVTTATTAVTTATTPITITLDSYDINSNDTYRPIFANNSDGDEHSRYFLNSKLTVTVTGGQASKTFYVYAVFR